MKIYLSNVIYVLFPLYNNHLRIRYVNVWNVYLHNNKT